MKSRKKSDLLILQKSHPLQTNASDLLHCFTPSCDHRRQSVKQTHREAASNFLRARTQFRTKVSVREQKTNTKYVGDAHHTREEEKTSSSSSSSSSSTSPPPPPPSSSSSSLLQRKLRRKKKERKRIHWKKKGHTRVLSPSPPDTACVWWSSNRAGICADSTRQDS